MAKKDFTAALDASLNAESKAVEDRFSRADAYYSEKESMRLEPQLAPNVKKPKAVRHIFTMLPEDHDLIETLRKACTRSDVDANKSLIVRAGLHALNAMPESELLKLVASLERLKPGRKSM